LKIVNRDRGIIISDNADVADSFFSRLRGLMFSHPRDLVLVSPKEDIDSSTIHMIFMKFPIDVLWLDSKMMVVDIKMGVPPFSILKGETRRIYRPGKAARYVVELGIGKLGTTMIGDKIEFADL
jgi:uncharacterized membrane protein (UPF0127 family)